MEPNQGIVYILTNPAIPNMIKIGMTTHEDVKLRMAQIYTTGVPLPFECVYAAKVLNYEKVEKALHIAFGPDRVNPKREFFEIDPMQAIAIIKLMEIEDVTPKVANEKEEVDEIDREAGEAYAKKKRPRFSFGEMNIPIGSELVCVANGESVSVSSDRSVIFRGTETSLTNATRTILNNSYHVAPGPYWTYNGKKLRDIYNETYLADE
ncbi:GIY-YIG nuclease family protein [Flavisolibacter ginsenosidimutans]|uniref:GIY-YIG nuclease family protein n=1 Tax=Flavisolibacter ginsenosidimutans TaxID=661481 RepID=A0A5B8UJP2_9BACT|nr:GIY-YIG nuclease family protein [Flavisolibacter ginsenosidimutans]QEC56626.1 GIY-YIG nuclease family protein [Flavisolibacter ginsenosidimutans]